MKRIKLSIDNRCYSSRPHDSEMGAINNRIAKGAGYLRIEKLKDLAKHVGENGCSFSPATFHNDIRSMDNFEQTQLFVLDFDGKLSLKDVYIRAERYDLPILFSYETFSSINNSRFRAVFLNDIPIPDIRVAKIMHGALRMIYPESDKNCSVVHVYYGGKQLIDFNESIPTINIDLLIKNMTIYLKDRYGATNYKRHLLNFARTHNISLTKKRFLDIGMEEYQEHEEQDTHPRLYKEYPTEASGANPSSNQFSESNGLTNNYNNSPISIILNRFCGDELSNMRYRINIGDRADDAKDSVRGNERGSKDNSDIGDSKESAVSNSRKIHNEYRSYVLNEISSACKLYNEFESGSRRLNHDELLGIGTNLIQVESGIKKFIEILGHASNL